jgi:hypothetical protein
MGTNHVEHFGQGSVRKVFPRSIVGLVRGLDQLHDFICKSECNLFCLGETTCFYVFLFQGGNLFILHADVVRHHYVLPPGIEAARLICNTKNDHSLQCLVQLQWLKEPQELVTEIGIECLRIRHRSEDVNQRKQCEGIRDRL